eukprot:CAMPEP_0174888058 /NCGR_PEP_ID=MMETSP0167-20121228/3331_1 /TAXON_ID=38298 /ORGANISM="Rhodella maculata, Strain CCMP736" /LENGTH=614 /DNA_ID=CAMNT_0016124861 /DNA_START=392 /DNA_END=2236 /DNA_ORIENTATION=+
MGACLSTAVPQPGAIVVTAADTTLGTHVVNAVRAAAPKRTPIRAAAEEPGNVSTGFFSMSNVSVVHLDSANPDTLRNALRNATTLVMIPTLPDRHEDKARRILKEASKFRTINYIVLLSHFNVPGAREPPLEHNLRTIVKRPSCVVRMPFLLESIPFSLHFSDNDETVEESQDQRLANGRIDIIDISRPTDVRAWVAEKDLGTILGKVATQKNKFYNKTLEISNQEKMTMQGLATQVEETLGVKTELKAVTREEFQNTMREELPEHDLDRWVSLAHVQQEGGFDNVPNNFSIVTPEEPMKVQAYLSSNKETILRDLLAEADEMIRRVEEGQREALEEGAQPPAAAAVATAAEDAGIEEARDQQAGLRLEEEVEREERAVEPGGEDADMEEARDQQAGLRLEEGVEREERAVEPGAGEGRDEQLELLMNMVHEGDTAQVAPEMEERGGEPVEGPVIEDREAGSGETPVGVVIEDEQAPAEAAAENEWVEYEEPPAEPQAWVEDEDAELPPGHEGHELPPSRVPQAVARIEQATAAEGRLQGFFPADFEKYQKDSGGRPGERTSEGDEHDGVGEAEGGEEAEGAEEAVGPQVDIVEGQTHTLLDNAWIKDPEILSE